MFSPERAQDAEGDQEHGQGGTVADSVHDLELQQVCMLQREAQVSPACPSALAGPSVSQSTGSRQHWSRQP